MHVIVLLASGIVAGWLTGLALKGQGYGFLGNLLIGSVGGLVGGWVVEFGLQVTPASGGLVHVLTAFVGGVVLVSGVRVFDQAARRAGLVATNGGAQVAITDLEGGVRKLGELEKRVLDQLLKRKTVTTNANLEYDKQTTFGQRVADQVAAFGGSWTFIFLFLGMMAIWMATNLRSTRPFDPYPFILLNLVLSCLAALQAPVIMMSQNRQAVRDRLDAQTDYKVNLNAEMQILSLHTKFDELRERQWSELVALQQKQIALLEALIPRPDRSE